MLAVSFLTTLFFEVSQETGLFGLYPGPYRLFDVDDLLLNTAGAVAGYWLTPLLLLPATEKLRKVDSDHISLFRRVGALTLDVILQSILSALFLVSLGGKSNPEVAFGFNLFGVLVWFVVIPSLWQGKTLGKHLFLFRIVSKNGERSGFWSLLLRATVLLIVPSLANHAAPSDSYVGFALLLLELAFFTAFMVFRADRRGPHELLSKTVLRDLNHTD